jgi:hypothetical protein
MTIINDDSRVVNKLETSLTDDARVVIYDCHMFIVQATSDITITCQLNGIRPIDFWPNDIVSESEKDLNFFFNFRRPFLWVHLQLRGFRAAGHELLQPLLAAVVGGHRQPLQEHGALGVLLLQVPAP